MENSNSKGFADNRWISAHKIMKTLRVKIENRPGKFGEIATAIGSEGGLLGDITKIKLDSHHIVRDVVVYIDSDDHLRHIIRTIKSLRGIKLLRIIDEVQELHRGGKIKMSSRVPLRTIADLRKIYTPGVAAICLEIVKSPQKVRNMVQREVMSLAMEE